MQKQHAAQKAAAAGSQPSTQPGTPKAVGPQPLAVAVAVAGDIDAQQKQVASMQAELAKMTVEGKKCEAENKELKAKLEKALEAVQMFNKEFDGAKAEIGKLSDENEKARLQVQMQKEQLEQQRSQFQQQQQVIQKGMINDDKHNERH